MRVLRACREDSAEPCAGRRDSESILPIRAAPGVTEAFGSGAIRVGSARATCCRLSRSCRRRPLRASIQNGAALSRVALVLVTALASFESTVVSTAMPTIIGDLGGLPLYAWVFSVYLLTSTVAMPVYGRLADIHGRRRLILVAIAVFLTGAIVCAFARSMPQLIAARAIQGLGAAGLIPVALDGLADLYSLEERARIQGLFSGVWGFASPRRTAPRRVLSPCTSAGGPSSRSTSRSARSRSSSWRPG